MSDNAASSSASGGPAAVWRPSVNPWLIAVAVMLATFLEVLDTSISAVALGDIAGSLSATTDESTWVLTSYLVANAIILPASGWMAIYFGRKRFLLGCITLFTLSSLLCGAAFSLGMLVVSRVIPGGGRRCPAAPFAGDPAGELPAAKARHGHGGVCDRCGGRPCHRAYDGRLADG